MPDTNSRGAALASRFQDALRAVGQAPRPGARELPVIRGLTLRCESVGPLENKLSEATEILRVTNRLYRYGNTVVNTVGEGENGRLVTLATDKTVEAGAAGWMTNIFVCEIAATSPDQPPRQFPPPRKFLEVLLRREPTLAALPEITHYARRPVFDQQFQLLGPGYHSESGTLVHGIDIEPEFSTTDIKPGSSVWSRLPRHLSTLLRDFCFRQPADAANAVAVMLTGMLSLHFVRDGKPLFTIDGNQAGVGKTLVARVCSVVLDGIDPKLIDYSPDEEELRKRILATLWDHRQAVVIFDNAKVQTGKVINSPVIESNSTGPQISLRILGKSENFYRPNDVLWFVTMNGTQLSKDLVSRQLPIRFYHEGDPKEREFGQRNPLQYAQDYRQEILGELAGMVIRWNQAGRPEGSQRHRLTHWAKIIGGILEANGLPEGLTNLDEAAAEFDTTLEQLSALAETVIVMNGPFVTATRTEGDAP